MEFRTVLWPAGWATLPLVSLLSRLIPFGAQLIILTTFIGVAENLVGLVEFLELFPGALLIFGHIGMISAGELAIRLLDRLGARISPVPNRAPIPLEPSAR